MKPTDENKKKEALIELLKEEPIDVLSLAYVYAKNVHLYGVDVTKAWETATHQSAALQEAAARGYIEGQKTHVIELEEERINRQDHYH